MTNLDIRLKAALDAEAERAPIAPPWSAPRRTRPASAPRRSHPGWIYAGGLVATVASVIGVLVVATRDTEPANAPADASSLPTSPMPVWTPPGEHFPLEDLGPAERISTGTVALAELTRRIGVENHPALTAYSTIEYVGGASIEAWRCLASDGGGAGCAPVDLARPEIGVTSSVDNRIAEFDLWTWSNVPADAAYVVYGEGADDGKSWQVPVFGVAAFPNEDWFDSVAVAYSADGVEVGRVDPTVLELAQQSSPNSRPPAADLESLQLQEVAAVMNESARSCLIAAGADFGSGQIGRLGNGDADSIWAGCVGVAGTDVEAWLAANDIRFFDPATERPIADEPYIVYDD